MMESGRLLYREEGQTLVFMISFLVLFVALLALVLNIGSLLRADHEAQTVVDAAALAGAQELPLDNDSAETLARDYARANGHPLDSSNAVGDEIHVSASYSVSSLFSKLLGPLDLAVKAGASARVEVPSFLLNTALKAESGDHTYFIPIAIPSDEACGQDAGKTCLTRGGPVNVKVICLPGVCTDNELADAIQCNPCAAKIDASQSVVAGPSPSGPNVKSAVKNDLETGSTLIFPVYDSTGGPGASLRISGFTGFLVKSASCTPRCRLRGSFVQYTTEGQGLSDMDPGTVSENYGVRMIGLTN